MKSGHFVNSNDEDFLMRLDYHAQRICGVDEAGRGPLAGAVYAAAVILDPSRPLIGLRDSKKLSEAKRDQYFTGDHAGHAAGGGGSPAQTRSGPH